MAETDEARLIARCQQGDRASQEILVRRCQDRVYRLACGLLGDPEDALDATQDALVAMLRSLPSYRGEARFHTWLFQLTSNVCLMQRRRQRVRTRVLSDLPVEELLAAAPGADPERRALDREAQQAIREHLAKLPAEFRAVVVLRELEGMAYEEIAAVLGLRIGTVQSRLSRGRRLLRDAFLSDERVTTPGGERR